MTCEDISDVARPSQSGLTLTLRAKPNSRSGRGLRIVDVGDGKRAIEVAISAAPIEGKANQAIIEKLADELGLAKLQIKLKSGETGRLKVVEIKGEPHELLARLSKILS